MAKGETKAAAEAVLRELPSVLGAFVREDVFGQPREIHLLVTSGPNPRHLARDVRELLEERLGIPVDQRVISIAQMAAEATPPASIMEAAHAAHGDLSATSMKLPVGTDPEPSPDQRLRYLGLESLVGDGRIVARARLVQKDTELLGEASELAAGSGRTRAGAAAALNAANRTIEGSGRLELDNASIVRAFERDFALVSVLLTSPFLGRRPVPLAGAQPVEETEEGAGALAALKAINRSLALLLRLGEGDGRMFNARARR
ncbi:MAG: hypothetical protein ABIV28_08075 [Longimicrobiales bacterium]